MVVHHIHNKHDSGINSCHFSPSEYQVNYFSDAVSEDQHLVIRSTLVNHGEASLSSQYGHWYGKTSANSRNKGCTPDGGAGDFAIWQSLLT